MSMPFSIVLRSYFTQDDMPLDSRDLEEVENVARSLNIKAFENAAVGLSVQV